MRPAESSPDRSEAQALPAKADNFRNGSRTEDVVATVTLAIFYVLTGGSPFQIAESIVAGDAIEVARLHALRARAVKSLEDQ
jgi:hypothetical protein